LKIASEDRRLWLSTIRLAINGCLLYAPWSAVLIGSFLTESSHVRETSTLQLLRDMLYSFTNNLWWMVIPPLLLSLLFMRQREIRFLWMWMGVTLIIALLGNLKADFLVHPRHVIGLLPPIVLTMAFALYQVNHRFPAAMGVFVGIWVGAGIAYSFTPDTYMDNLPAHVLVPPTSLMDTVLDAAATCISDDDAVFFALDTAYEEWINDLPIIYYLGDFDFRKLVISYALHDVRAPSLLLSDDLAYLNDAQPIDRFQYMVDDAALIWVFARTDRPLEHHLGRMAAAFDCAASSIRTQFPFGADLSETARPVAVGGSHALIQRGEHREAVFWIAVTYARCAAVLAVDGPADAALDCELGLRALMRDLGAESFADMQRRGGEIERFLPQLMDLAADLVAGNRDLRG
jgi:hypothetical protein